MQVILIGLEVEMLSIGDTVNLLNAQLTLVRFAE